MRKFFDFAVRVSPLGRSDLIDFANAISKDTGIQSEIIQIGVLAKCDDARKMKHFVNTFITKTNILYKRENYLPYDFKVEEHLSGLAKVIVIEELFPDVFQRIAKEPYFMNRLEDCISEKSSDEESQKYLSNNIELKAFLEATSHVKIKHPELFVLLKISNLQYKVPRGFELYNAILTNNKETLKDILLEISSDIDKVNLINLVKNDMLDKANRIFLSNIIDFCLNLFKSNFFNDKQRHNFAEQICPYLLKQHLHQYDINTLFSVANLAGDNWDQRIANKLRNETKSLTGINPKLSQIINTFYENNLFTKYSNQYVNDFIQLIDSWVLNNKNEEVYLKIIDQIKIPGDKEIKAGQPIIPNNYTILKIINNISPNDEIELIELKRKIIFDRWDDSVAKPFSEKLNTILIQYASETKFSPILKSVFTSIVDMPAWLDSAIALSIGNYALNFYQRCHDNTGKTDAIKVILIAANSTNEPSHRTNLMKFVYDNLSGLEMTQVKEIDDFANKHDNVDLFKSFKEKSIRYYWEKFVIPRINNPDKDTKPLFELCFENKSIIKDEPVHNVIRQMCQSENALFFWKETIIKYSQKFGEPFISDISTNLMDIIKNKNNEAYQNNCAELLIELLNKIPTEKRNTIIARFMNCLVGANAVVRKTAVSSLEKIKNISDENFFKTTLNNITREICDKNPNEIIALQSSLEATLHYKEFWTEDEWKDLAKLVKWLFDLNNNENIHNYGRELIERFSKIPEQYVQDLTASLIVLAKSANSQKDREESVSMLKNMREKLNKKQIDKYLKPEENNNDSKAKE